MSWAGPSAPRVLGMAEKRFVVSICASKFRSTASAIRAASSGSIMREPPLRQGAMIARR